MLKQARCMGGGGDKGGSVETGQGWVCCWQSSSSINLTTVQKNEGSARGARFPANRRGRWF